MKCMSVHKPLQGKICIPTSKWCRIERIPLTTESDFILPWHTQKLFESPREFPADGFEECEGIRPIFFEGPPWRGKSTRVFAWMGIPEGNQLPAMVLIHGGGGTALFDWVRLWNERGYAAISMDTCGAVPRGEYGRWERHQLGGPPGWGGFERIDDPIEDQWTYHAVADVVLAHSLLAEQPDVDARRVGLTGISWGGYLSCIATSVDARFRFNVPVYGCGRYDLCPVWDRTFAKLGLERAQKWIRLWDATSYLPLSTQPFLWVAGTNDSVYPLNAVKSSYKLIGGPLYLSIRLRMPHGHGGPGEKPAEIHALADHILGGGPPLPEVSDPDVSGRVIEITCLYDSEVVASELLFTKDIGIWEHREWYAVPARHSPGACSAEIPPGTTVCYLNITTREGLTISSKHVEM
ncbi:MAG: prolyl oligopeptidase family serine peptidase [Theionarchaea archaeon]|nr:prolyl oligopeptidase family serine peptidase [Theionarchaea archaeon]